MQNRLIVVHPKQIIESEQKWHDCFGTMQTKLSWSSGKGLTKYLHEYADESLC